MSFIHLTIPVLSLVLVPYKLLNGWIDRSMDGRMEEKIISIKSHHVCSAGGQKLNRSTESLLQHPQSILHFAFIEANFLCLIFPT